MAPSIVTIWRPRFLQSNRMRIDYLLKTKLMPQINAKWGTLHYNVLAHKPVFCYPPRWCSRPCTSLLLVWVLLFILVQCKWCKLWFFIFLVPVKTPMLAILRQLPVFPVQPNEKRRRGLPPEIQTIAINSKLIFQTAATVNILASRIHYIITSWHTNLYFFYPSLMQSSRHFIAFGGPSPRRQN